MRIQIDLRPPDSSLVDFAAYVKAKNEWRRSRPRGYADNEAWELTTINGYAGMQIESGINYMGVKEGPVQSELQEPRPSVAVWYDSDRQAQYTVRAPDEAKLGELRAVVDSMY